MSRSHWLLRLRRWQSAPRPLTSRGRRVRPELELLEQRTLLSGSIPLTPGAWTSIGPAPIQNGEVGVGGSNAVYATSITTGTGRGICCTSAIFKPAPEASLNSCRCLSFLPKRPCILRASVGWGRPIGRPC